MGVVDSFGNDPDVLGGASAREWALAHKRRQVATVHIVHREVVMTFAFTHLMDGDDVRVLQVGGRFGFLAEALDVGDAGELTGQDHLYRDRSMKADLPRLVDHAHSTAGDFLEEFVVAEMPEGWSLELGWAAARYRGVGGWLRRARAKEAFGAEAARGVAG